MTLTLFPAIDLRDGRCVRLTQGDFAREKTYGDDPVAQAGVFAAAGAEWLHVVDLDAARTGRAHNLDVIGAICAAVDVPVQSGGGVRDRAKAEALFDAGVARLVVGTAALDDPGFVAELAAAHPGGVAVGLDARATVDDTGATRWSVAVRGWETDSGRDLLDIVGVFAEAGVAALIVTEIGRDGTMAGPDRDGLSKVLAATASDVIASGGVGTLDDIRALVALESNGRRLSGAIIGRALYEERFTLDQALTAARV
ncbi:MAG: 1-(5-phosphoribosyl)-5-[(5-phosphoribosylamino)methylideneamino]imidazole-4-carboxamide isomerase [Actinobacteria bacterium]|nr:1-(5-phosphoribosyl)-5-[(5-phosphoribosylamino)methylideneamino]imidazole-4-carboxamide isomerase [Actinomycetota bacterium]